MPAVVNQSLGKAIYELHKQGLSYRDIADRLGIGQATVILAIRRKQKAAAKGATAWANKKAREALIEKPVDTKLKGFQVVSIWEEFLSLHPKKWNPRMLNVWILKDADEIASTLDVPCQDVVRILKDLDGNPDNLKRVICQEKYGNEIWEGVGRELRTETQRNEITKSFRLSENDIDAIYQSFWRTTGPSELEWQSHCQEYLDERKARRELDDSLESLPFPRRCVVMLEPVGVRTISRLQSIIDGSDEEFVGGLDSVPNMDIDSRDRIMAVLNDDINSGFPDTVPYHGPLPHSNKEGPPPKCVDTHNWKVKIKLTVEISDQLPVGAIVVGANIIPSGQAMFTTEDGTLEFAQVGEFETDLSDLTLGYCPVV